jgi:hypothetical protein
MARKRKLADDMGWMLLATSSQQKSGEWAAGGLQPLHTAGDDDDGCPYDKYVTYRRHPASQQFVRTSPICDVSLVVDMKWLCSFSLPVRRDAKLRVSELLEGSSSSTLGMIY